MAAESKTKQVVETARRQSGTELAASLRELNRQVKLYIAVGDLSRARTFCGEAEAIGRRAFEQSDPPRAVCLGNRGGLHLAAGALHEAETALTAAAERLRRNPTDTRWSQADRLEFADVLADLAELHVRKGDLARAVAVQVEALRILKDHVGAGERQLLGARNSLANLYCAIGELDKAEPLLNESYTVCAETARVEETKTVETDVVRTRPSQAAQQELLLEMARRFDPNPPVDPLAALQQHFAPPGSLQRGRSFGPSALGLRRSGGFGMEPNPPVDPLSLMQQDALAVLRKLRTANPPVDPLSLVQQRLGRLPGSRQPGRSFGPSALGLRRSGGFDAGSASPSQRINSRLQQEEQEYRQKYGFDQTVHYEGGRTILPPWAKTARVYSAMMAEVREHEQMYGRTPAWAQTARQTYVERTQHKLVKPPPLGKFSAYLSTANQMTDLYLVKGNLARAEQVLGEGQGFLTRLKLDNSDLPAVRMFVFHQGRLQALKGDGKQARAFFHRAIPRADPRGPLAAMVTRSEALLDLQAGDARHAAMLLRGLLQQNLEEAQNVLPGFSEAEALSFVEANLQDRHVLLQTLGAIGGTTAPEAYEPVWRTRALATRAIAEQRRWAAIGGAAAEPLLNQRRDVSQEMSALAHSPVPDDATERQKRKRRLDELNEAKERLEKKLAEVSRPFRREQGLQAARVADLAAALPPGTVLVDFVQTRVDRPDELLAGRGRPVSHYDAFVVHGGRTEAAEAVAWVKLGPAEPIDRAIADWRSELSARVSPSPGAGGPSARLRRLVWDPIERHLRDGRTIVIIPDQALTRVPWPALPGSEPGTFLLDRYAITTAPHGQGAIDILSRNHDPAGEPRLLLLGGADYDGVPAAPADAAQLAHAGTRGLARSNEAGTRSGWSALPGTLAEVDALRTLWGRPATLTLLTGSQASEPRLRRAMPRNRFIHLATHGFFADPAYRSAFQNDLTSGRLFGLLDEATDDTPFHRSTVAGRNPLLLCGVVLAGANRPPRTDDQGRPTGDDGIFTAEEVACLDLADTELVVLSACQTGLGDVAGGEGVFGLQRAFHLAGARSTIASLWHVDDQATQALMVEFYRNLWERKLSKVEALRQAQLTMRARYDPSRRRLERGREVDRPGRPQPAEPPGVTTPTPSRQLAPYYWAAFTLSGDWR
jgi:CHAT domain-containing protein/tetratricopeptide (TPR) repeat protein